MEEESIYKFLNEHPAEVNEFSKIFKDCKTKWELMDMGGNVLAFSFKVLHVPSKKAFVANGGFFRKTQEWLAFLKVVSGFILPPVDPNLEKMGSKFMTFIDDIMDFFEVNGIEVIALPYDESEWIKELMEGT